MKQNDSRIKILIPILVLIIAGIFIYGYVTTNKSHGENSAIAGLREPIQLTATGSEKRTVNGYDTTITYLYSYDIDALVISTKTYIGSGMCDTLSPMDVGLAWGPIAEYNDRINFNWDQSGRWLYWTVDSFEALKAVGGVENVSKNISNNHLIPADKTIKRQIRKIRTGDHVRLTGYLVNIDASKSNGSTFYWHSSTTRDDNGDGSCEVFYVTGVEFL